MFPWDHPIENVYSEIHYYRVAGKILAIHNTQVEELSSSYLWLYHPESGWWDMITEEFVL